MFQFKHFTIDDDRCAMKIGTDGVLLGAWTNVENPCLVLDIGTGSGLIALMIAQRTEKTEILAIDIDEEAVSQAKLNVSKSPWSGRVDVIKCDFNNPHELNNKTFDLIVSNPPFFTEDTHSDDIQRDKARNADALPIDSLMKNALRLLSDDGILSLIVPAELCSIVIGTAAINSLFLSRRCDVYTKTETPAKRALLEFSKSISPTCHSELCINNLDGTYSSQFQKLTSDFYL